MEEDKFQTVGVTAIRVSEILQFCKINWENLKKKFPPTNFNQYKLDCSKGVRGGFGIVYFGVDRNGNSIAAKRISPRGDDEDYRIRREIAAYSILKHSNLLQIFGWCQDDTNDIYIFMEKADSNLKQFLSSQKSILSVPGIRFNFGKNFAIQFLRGLEYLHSMNLAHRDLKHDNILVFQQNGSTALKIADYGLLRPAKSNTTGTDKQITLQWAPPEHLFPKRYDRDEDTTPVTAELLKGDVFSAGYLLWYLWKMEEFNEEVDQSEYLQEFEKALDSNEFPLPLGRIPWADIIKQCWNYNINARPTIHEVLLQMENLTEKIN